ncbi:MAG TPA: DUF1800 domain-containing protein [Terriglobia bacterium]|jgi:uncharacterized protein (DUF1800 family)
MKRVGYYFAIAASLIIVVAFLANAAGRFDQKLPLDKQAIHVLNRLTFGARPGDVEQVRRLGVEKWIDQQLHPDRIPENPVLESKVKALTTVLMPGWQIAEKYSNALPGLIVGQALSIVASLTPQQRSQLQTGSAEQRMAALISLDTEKRRLYLASAAPQALEGFPEDIRQEADNARKVQQAERQKEIRKSMPPLMDLLTPDQIKITRTGTPEQKIALLNSFDADKRKQVVRAIPFASLGDVPELRREAMAVSQPQQFVNFELTENKLYRAIYSNHQLEEVLVDFWMNHFNVYNGKGNDRVLLTGFERDAIRPYVFGHFKDMLLATARHPAMLFYLDNWQSQSPQDPPFGLILPANIRRPGINENYGRELMELHTLGVNGGYTQADVIAVARAFTGWTIYDPQRFAEFQFNPANHDRKEKVVLGHTIPAMGAEQDGVQVIDILAHHPSTAKFISKELAQRFVADDPPQSLVDRMAATFIKTDGDLRAVMQTMFSSVEFMSEGAWQNKMKSPLEMVVAAVRAMNADVTDTYTLAQKIADMGEPLYGKLEPTGYPNTGEAWTNTASVLGRINFAAALASGQVPGVTVDVNRFNAKTPAVVARDILSMPPSPATLAAIQKGIEGSQTAPSTLASLVMGSPDFQRR